eukprot:gene39920-52698_t
MQPIMQEVCEYDLISYKKNILDFPFQYPDESSKLTTATATATATAPTRSISDRLKDLKQLLDENLINKEQHDYQ